MIRSFLETSINPIFSTNAYHLALYQWFIEDNRDIPTPRKRPYFSEEMFSNIRMDKEQGLLNVAKLSSGNWYKVLLENNVTMNSPDERTLKPCRSESNNPGIDWKLTRSLACLEGLSSDDKTFVWKMFHNIPIKAA